MLFVDEKEEDTSYTLNKVLELLNLLIRKAYVFNRQEF